MQNEKVICNKFSFAYDSNTFGIHDIDLTIQEGEFIVLTGKSGCGKTTLTRCINGLIPDFFEGTITGSCRVCGMDISEHETGDYSSYVGSVFQDPRSQFFTLHVKTEIPFPSENLGTPSSVIQDRFRNTVKQLNISNLLKKSIFELSSGEKQKVAIASIYTANVQIYVLDEPSANLDWEGTKQLKKLLGQLKEQGCTIIISEHKLYYLKDLADRVVILKDGQINTILSGNEFKAQSTNWFHDNGLRQVNLKDIVCNPASVKAATREQVSVRAETYLLGISQNSFFGKMFRSSARVEILLELSVKMERGILFNPRFSWAWKSRKAEKSVSPVNMLLNSSAATNRFMLCRMWIISFLPEVSFPKW